MVTTARPCHCEGRGRVNTRGGGKAHREKQEKHGTIYMRVDPICMVMRRVTKMLNLME